MLEKTAGNTGPTNAPDPDRLATQIEELTELNANLLSSMIEVLAGFQRALAQMQRREGELSVSAGPFASLEAVRAFGRELAGMPGVKAVDVRGYEGEDRAVIDVRVSTSTT
jgi:hypothetical protein